MYVLAPGRPWGLELLTPHPSEARRGEWLINPETNAPKTVTPYTRKTPNKKKNKNSAP